MKRIVPALALGLLAFGGCTDFRSDVFIQGHVGPSTLPCTYAPGSGKTFITGAALEARGEQLLVHKLELIIGLQLVNNTSTPEVSGPSGNPTSLPTRDDAQVTEVDVNITQLDGTTQVASENLLASGYIPGQGGNGVVLVDLMGAPLADVIRKQMAFPNPNPAPQQLLMSLVAKGKLVSGTAFQTEPFQHELDITYTDYFRSGPDASGTVTTVAVLPDGGFSDESIAADGTQTLLNDGNEQYNSVLAGAPAPDGGFAVPPLAGDGGLFSVCE